MTGYGKASAEYNGKKITAEIRSLNSKALDLTTRVASLYREKDMELRSVIAKQLERGKVEFSLWIEQTGGQEVTPINGTVASAYYKQLKAASQEFDIPEPAEYWPLLLRMPDVMSRTEVQELTDEEWAVAYNVALQAIDHLVEFRKQEGLALAEKFRGNIQRIGDLLASIEPFEKERTERIKQRLRDTLEAIPGVEYDRGRLEQEMIFYIEKLDINEEKQRLSNHLQYFIQTMEDGQGQGKKLGFIAQEMGREINTTGSKSNQAEMQNIVVKMKDELEQIKEQVLNVM